MKTLRLLLPVLGLIACGAVRADDTKSTPAPRVDVVYVNPEKFTDLRDSYADTGRFRDEYLGDLKEHIEKKANKYIPEGQHLALRITDVKMAGDFEPQRGPRFEDVRIIRDIYPPRINLEFKLTDASGKVLKEGVRKISDINFLATINPYFPDDTLRYEKKLLDDWFYNEFGEAKG
ncbi:MAG TPA: DUF3016 domain-containing protein [Opitutaceae bacterium]|jgi:hypothetical protein|nr:DUF3016 domain-containing protein [Opitutaceae bacterium]